MKPAFLKPEVWARLKELGLDEIHQSDLSRGRTCRKQLLFYVQSGRWQKPSINMLLGSILHRFIKDAVEELEYSPPQHRLLDRSSQFGYIKTVVAETMAGYDGVTHKNREVEPEEVILLAIRNVYGMTMYRLAMAVAYELKRLGLRMRAVEYKIVMWPFEGTIDIVCANPVGRRVLIDTKSYGMWAKWLGHGNITGQSFTEAQVTWMVQLRHYHWMLASKYGEDDMAIEKYGILIPANLIPKQTGPDKGKARGPLLFLAPAAPLEGYQEDMLEWLDSWSRNQPRDYPNNFGKPSCPECPFHAVCMKGVSINSLAPDYLDELSEEEE